jgi:methylthioribose-1-phosphate isomerase
LKIQGQHYRTIWIKEDDPATIQIIDQRKLPFIFKIIDLQKPEDAYIAIKDMAVRGAPLTGITAAWGMYLALLKYKGRGLKRYMEEKATLLKSARPTAVNPRYTTDTMLSFILSEESESNLIEKTFNKVKKLEEDEIDYSNKIGEFGLTIIESIYRQKGDRVNILTHCNAGWLACIDWGTATAPVYKAHRRGIPVHVWVDETRPRNQGARLTAFELGEEGVPHTVIADNTGGHIMQHGLVDMVLVGSDRTTMTGHTANKIGTYLKALAAKDNNIPFYVALPSSSIDWTMEDGLNKIPIEERGSDEVAEIEGWNGNEIQRVRLVPEQCKTVNYGFDVTPARLITGLISERGICEAKKNSILKLYPEKHKL